MQECFFIRIIITRRKRKPTRTYTPFTYLLYICPFLLFFIHTQCETEKYWLDQKKKVCKTLHDCVPHSHRPFHIQNTSFESSKIDWNVKLIINEVNIMQLIGKYKLCRKKFILHGNTNRFYYHSKQLRFIYV